MLTQNQQPQVKDLLDRASIRTMKKDLKRLREADAKKEGRKISSLDTLEAQKQELFALNAQKQDLQNQLNKTGGANKGAKDSVLSQEKKWEQKLAGVIQKQQKTADETKQENLEKTRWQVERKVEAAKSNLRAIDEHEQKQSLEKARLQEKIHQVDADAFEIKSTIKKTQETPPVPASKPVPAPQAPRDQKPEKEFLRNMPEPAKQALRQTAEAENAQRQKFMEEVEAWARQEHK